MITVVDYGAGNIGSVLNMIRKVGGEATSTGDAETLSDADKILLPGVGSFDNAMARLNALGLTDVLKERATKGIPFLGICLGMQLLSDGSEEGEMDGLGLIPGQVRRFSFKGEDSRLKIPHMGWNQISVCKKHLIAEGLESDARFYFVHSFHYVSEDPADVLFKTNYGYDFTSGIQRGRVIGVQFHPEKSHRFGMQLMKNFIEL